MRLDMIFNEDLENLTDEMLANRILVESGVNYNDVPIIIEKVATNLGFRLAKISAFANDDIIAGIAYAEKEIESLKSNRYIIIRNDVDIRDRRYLLSLALSYYIVHSKNDYYVKTITKDILADINSTKAERIARAILMPQKSMSTLLMSPMISKLDSEEKVNSVAKAFLVSNYVARIRMMETGFFM